MLHFFIGLLIGLWSFAIAMWACLIFLSVPMGVQLPVQVRAVITAPGWWLSMRRNEEYCEV
jgi:uncharacterized membrane protein